MSTCEHGALSMYGCPICTNRGMQNALAGKATSFAAEARQLLVDDRDHWKARALAAELELRKWYGFVNKERPDLKPTIMQRLGSLFHVKKARGR